LLESRRHAGDGGFHFSIYAGEGSYIPGGGIKVLFSKPGNYGRYPGVYNRKGPLRP
jgi:hypothetical protein